MSTLIDKVYAARRVATPLIAISTPDPAATIAAVRDRFETGAKTQIPLVRWDAHMGLTGLNAPGVSALVAVLGDDKTLWAGISANPGAALGFIADLPGELRESGKVDGKIVSRGTMVFALNLGRYCEEKAGAERGPVVQGVWNLRDAFKRDRRTLVMLGPAFKFPAEIAQDVIVFDEPLPDVAALQKIVAAQVTEFGVDELSEKVMDQATDAVRGLPAFTTEQVVAMSLTPDGLNVDDLWERKIVTISQIDGISVDRFGAQESFENTGGLRNFKEFSLLLARGESAPIVILRFDEFEKAIAGIGAGASGSNGGIQNQDKLGQILEAMEDNDWPGLICVGPPGSGKSQGTKSLASAASAATGRRVLSIKGDLGATEGSLVGESEKKIRAMLKALLGLAGRSRLVVVATCNKLERLPPELKRRFRLGTWMFDLPSAEEKAEVWKIQLARYFPELKDGVRLARPDDTNWTPADIRNCCDNAYRLRCSLVDATKYLVPVAKSDPESIDALRKVADGRFLSASYPGEYKSPGFLAQPNQTAAAAAYQKPARRAGRAEEV